MRRSTKFSIKKQDRRIQTTEFQYHCPNYSYCIVYIHVATLDKAETLKSFIAEEAHGSTIVNLTNSDYETIEEYLFARYEALGNIETDQVQQVGMEFNEGESIAWFSNQGLHMVPLALNVMNNVLLKGIKGLENDTIQVTNHPLPLDLNSQVNNNLGG